MGSHVVATVDEIPPGERKIVDVEGRSIGVFNLGDEFVALRNRCPHQGGPLCLGDRFGFLAARVPGEYRYERPGEFIRCPWHGWEFDLRTGQSWFDPGKRRVRTYSVRLATTSEVNAEAGEGSGGLRPGPYIAETFQVAVDRQYVVVDVPG